MMVLKILFAMILHIFIYKLILIDQLKTILKLNYLVKRGQVSKGKIIKITSLFDKNNDLKKDYYRCLIQYSISEQVYTLENELFFKEIPNVGHEIYLAYMKGDPSISAVLPINLYLHKLFLIVFTLVLFGLTYVTFNYEYFQNGSPDSIYP